MKARELTIEALEEFLAANARSTDEAESAGLYVDAPGQQESSGEQIAGIPAGEVVALVGPVVAPFLASIALTFLTKVKDEALGGAAKASVKWLKERFNGPEVKSHEDTVMQVTKALMSQGWPEGEARAAALDLWERGQLLSRKLAAEAPA